jgi:hypothetical protein
VTYESESKPASVELNYTCDTGKWPVREWKMAPGTLSGAGKAIAVLPDGARVCFFNLIDDRGLTVSSEHVEIPDGK